MPKKEAVIDVLQKVKKKKNLNNVKFLYLLFI